MVKNIGYTVMLIGILLVGNAKWASALSRNQVIQERPSVTKGIQQKTTIETGKDIYQKYCLTCHQIDGSGVPHTFPPLIKSKWVNGDKTILIRIVLNGLEGEIEVDDDTYNGIMPKQNNLTDDQISTVLIYIRQNFENNSSAISPKEVKALRGK